MNAYWEGDRKRKKQEKCNKTFLEQVFRNFQKVFTQSYFWSKVNYQSKANPDNKNKEHSVEVVEKEWMYFHLAEHLANLSMLFKELKTKTIEWFEFC